MHDSILHANNMHISCTYHKYTHTCTYYSLTFSHKISISVGSTYPELIVPERLWEYEEKWLEMMNLGFNIACSLIKGNRNQCGCHAWGQLLWELCCTAVQSVNKSFCYYDMKKKTRERH